MRKFSFIHKIHVAEGFDEDCENLIQQCLKSDKLNFETFCEIWKEMKFDTLYEGRILNPEIAELTEELILTAKHYMLANTSNYEESVAGLFIVYALLNLQPFTGFAALRLIPDDVQAINRIEMVARREKRLDVLYILGSVLIHGPCQYHADQRERGMESSYRKYLEGSYVRMDKSGVYPRGVFFRQNEELDMIRELAGITNRYAEAKKAITGGKEDPNLTFIDSNFPNELDSSLKKVISGCMAIELESEDRQMTVQEIKNRAMRGEVGPIRHLVTTNQRKTNNAEAEKQSKTPSPNKNNKKTQNRSKTPQNTASSKRKRKSKLSRKGRKKRKPSVDSYTESSNDDIVVCDFDDEDEGDEINLREFDKSCEFDKSNSPKKTIQIDDLPVFITTNEDGKELEIEIIDHYNKKYGECSQQIEIEYDRSPDNGECSKEIDCDRSQDNGKCSKEIDCDRSQDNGECSQEIERSHDNGECSQEVEIIDDGDKIKKENFKLKKVEKRDQKKPVLKSKFKRMGILPIANFKEK